MSNPQRSTDFVNYNKALQSQPYCIIYALEWFHDDSTYADMAVLKKNACTGETQYWYKENYFPSEPTFVASKKIGGNASAEAEDAGMLLFTAVDGATQQVCGVYEFCERSNPFSSNNEYSCLPLLF